MNGDEKPYEVRTVSGRTLTARNYNSAEGCLMMVWRRLRKLRWGPDVRRVVVSRGGVTLFTFEIHEDAVLEHKQ